MIAKTKYKWGQIKKIATYLLGLIYMLRVEGFTTSVCPDTELFLHDLWLSKMNCVG